MSGYCSLQATSVPSCSARDAPGRGSPRPRLRGRSSANSRLPVGAEFARHAAADEVPAHRRRVGLQLREFGGVFRRQCVGHSGEELRHLHQRPLQAAEDGAQVLGVAGAVGLDAEHALARRRARRCRRPRRRCAPCGGVRRTGCCGQTSGGFIDATRWCNAIQSDHYSPPLARGGLGRGWLHSLPDGNHFRPPDLMLAKSLPEPAFGGVPARGGGGPCCGCITSPAPARR